jgi:hypothetical protein
MDLITAHDSARRYQACLRAVLRPASTRRRASLGPRTSRILKRQLVIVDDELREFADKTACPNQRKNLARCAIRGRGGIAALRAIKANKRNVQ